MSFPERLVQISASVYLASPLSALSTIHVPASNQPTVILVFGWMGAKLPHLQKYIAKYDEIYPFATKVLVRSEASVFWATQSAKNARLAPVIAVLAALGCLPSTSGEEEKENLPRILVHTFSNGGCSQLAALSDILCARYPSAPALPSSSPSSSSPSPPTSLPSTPSPSPPRPASPSSPPAPRPLPPTALILDSCPGHGGLRATLRAFSASIPSLPLRALVTTALLLAYTAMLATRRLFRWNDPLEAIKRALNRERILPFFGVGRDAGSTATATATPTPTSPFDPSTNRDPDTNSTPNPDPTSRHPGGTSRLYIYSPADTLIPAAHVEAHARAAPGRVRLERFEGSAHVAHARADPARYWGAVVRAWEEAGGREV